MDVIKGGIRGQLRIKGRGAWVIVRTLLNILNAHESSHVKSASNGEISASETSNWYDKDNLLLGLDFVYAIMRTIFYYLVVVYLDFFTPVAEPKRRLRKRKEDTEAVDRSTLNHWDMVPLLELVVEALGWKRRFLTRILEEWVQIGLAWGGNRLIERQVRETLLRLTRPDVLAKHITMLYDTLLLLPDQAPAVSVQEPDIANQRAEYDELVLKLLQVAQQSTALALLLGRTEADQKQTIEEAISPFLAPSSDLARTSIVQTANARSLLVLLEQIAILLDPPPMRS
ncbi:hypothetical protein CBS101457_000928 [Exobasidium rhododendri]|nr:hypothetical protein CBS101457_000928 [Exobasidium rhododendri]